MTINQVKTFMNKIVYYDTGQRRSAAANSRIKIYENKCLFPAVNEKCVQRNFKICKSFVRKVPAGATRQAELKDTVCKNSVIIVPLEKVLNRDEI